MMGVAAGPALLVGAGVQALGAVSAGRAAEKQAEAQADISAEQAEQQRILTEAEIRDFTRNQSRFFAERRAALGASGVDPSTGTPVLAAEDFAAEVALQTDRIRKGGEIRTTRLEQEADLLREAGRSARTAGIFRAGSSLLTGIGFASEFGGSSFPSHGGVDIRAGAF